MKKSIIIQKRKEAKKLRQQGWGIRKIARYLMCSPASVSRWLRLTGDQLETDRRGWSSGRMRKYSDEEKERVMAVREELEQTEGVSIGAKAIRMRYGEKYGYEISEWFINRTLREFKESRAVLQKGRAMAPHTLPTHQLIRKIGRVIMRVDFWRGKESNQSNEIIHCLSCRYIRPHRFGILYRVSALSGEEVIRVLKSIWAGYMIPDIVEMGNHSAFGTNLTLPGYIGSVPLFLLNVGIKPLYRVSKKKM